MTRRLYPGTHAQERPDEAAIIFAPTDTVTTWRQLDARSNQIAHLLHAAGLRRGDGIAIMSENRPWYFEVVWAALRSGLYYTPINTYLTPDEVAKVLEASGARVIFASVTCKAQVSAAAPGLHDLVRRFVVDPDGSRADEDGWRSLDRALEGQPSKPLDHEPEGAPLWFSSGTSGQPKGVIRPLPDEPGDPVAMHYASAFGLSHRTVHLCLGPLHHAAPVGFSTSVLRLGGTVVLTDRFDPEDTLRLIAAHKVTFSHLVPTMFIRLLKLPEAVRTRYRLDSLERVIHGAAPCPVAIKRQMIEWWGPIIDEYYGGTEGIGSTTITASEWLDHPGSVGRPSRGVVHITTEDGAQLPPGSEGMVWFENAAGVTSYLGDPDQTAAITHPRGWQTLGDIGHVDPQGYLFLTDRWSHKIVTGGVNVFPREVEDVLLQHPAVLDVAVIGVPHDEMGEEVRAVVQALDGVITNDQLAEELIEFCLARLSRQKCPRSVDFDSALPRAENGKLYTRRIRDRYWSGRTSRIL